MEFQKDEAVILMNTEIPAGNEVLNNGYIISLDISPRLKTFPTNKLISSLLTEVN